MPSKRGAREVLVRAPNDETSPHRLLGGAGRRPQQGRNFGQRKRALWLILDGFSQPAGESQRFSSSSVVRGRVFSLNIGNNGFPNGVVRIPGAVSLAKMRKKQTTVHTLKKTFWSWANQRRTRGVVDLFNTLTRLHHSILTNELHSKIATGNSASSFELVDKRGRMVKKNIGGN